LERLKRTYEENIKAHGGHMTDEYGYSISGHELYDIRNLMHFSIITAKEDRNIDDLKKDIVRYTPNIKVDNDAVLVTNVRHYEALVRASESLEQVQKGLEMNTPTEFVSIDLREAIRFIGKITGEITSDEVLGAIFSRFCIGK
jgi:tRNA modification GTPase